MWDTVGVYLHGARHITLTFAVELSEAYSSMDTAIWSLHRILTFGTFVEYIPLF